MGLCCRLCGATGLLGIGLDGPICVRCRLEEFRKAQPEQRQWLQVLGFHARAIELMMMQAECVLSIGVEGPEVRDISVVPSALETVLKQWAIATVTEPPCYAVRQLSLRGGLGRTVGICSAKHQADALCGFWCAYVNTEACVIRIGKGEDPWNKPHSFEHGWTSQAQTAESSRQSRPDPEDIKLN